MGSCEHCGQEHGPVDVFCPNTGQLIPSRLLPEGTLLEGKYRVGRTLGIGGMGAVFLGHHTLLDKPVAIKVMLPEGGEELARQFSARLVREARAASATGHRNIAQVTDMGWARPGSLFVVMEYLEGQTLKQVLEQQPRLPLPRSVELMRQALAGLEVVHRKGIVHRDLKPDNLMLVRDEEGEELVKILDFGISKATAEEGQLHLTSTNLVIGTPQFMSPEQARRSDAVDHRSDIYSAGVILYRMVTGTLPHQQETLSALIAALLTEAVDPPSRRCPGLPVALDRVVLTALERDPARRYQSARAFSDALTALVVDSPSASSSTPAVPIPSLSGELDESSLVALDEAEHSPANRFSRPALDDQPAPQVVALDDRFAPPDEELEHLELNSEPFGATRGARHPVASPAVQEPMTTAEVALPRATGTYGQARRRQGRAGLWIMLAVTAAGALLAWQLVLRDGTSQTNKTVPDAGDYVQIRIEASPRFAQIQIDGVELTAQPLVLQRSTQQYVVTVRATGYWPQTLSFTPEQDRSLFVELKLRQNQN